MAMNGAPRIRKNSETTAKFKTRNNAECTAFRLMSMPAAEATAMKARMKKKIWLMSSGVISKSQIGKSQFPTPKSQKDLMLGIWGLGVGIFSVRVFHIRYR